MKNYSFLSLIKYKSFLLCLALFFLTLVFVGQNLNKPFIGIHDHNGARFGTIAKNYLRYGPLNIKLAQIESGGETTLADANIYTHYPPLLPFLIYLSYAAIGVSEFTTRAVPTLATAISIPLIYLIGSKLFNQKVGLSASIFTLATPLVRYYGKNPVHEPLVVMFALIVFLGTIIIHNKHRSGWKLIYIGLIGAFLTNWSAFFLLLAITFLHWSNNNRQKLPVAWLIGLAYMTYHFLFIKSLTGNLLGGGIGGAFLHRTALQLINPSESFIVTSFVNQIRLWLSLNYTYTFITISIIGTFLLLKFANKFQKKFVLALAIYGFSYPLIFSNATFVHSYFIYYLLPLLAITSGYFVNQISIKKNARWVFISLIIFLGILFEKSSYTAALQESNNDAFALQVAREIKQNTSPQDKVLVKPPDFTASLYPHLSFYSERNIEYDSDSDYNWIVQVDTQTQQITISTHE